MGTKVVYNQCYGGFGLSNEARERYAELANIDISKTSLYDISRTDPILIQVIEEIGDKANGEYAKLVIEELESGTVYRITEYDGFESIEIIGDQNWNVA